MSSSARETDPQIVAANNLRTYPGFEELWMVKRGESCFYSIRTLLSSRGFAQFSNIVPQFVDCLNIYQSIESSNMLGAEELYHMHGGVSFWLWAKTLEEQRLAIFPKLEKCAGPGGVEGCLVTVGSSIIGHDIGSQIRKRGDHHVTGVTADTATLQYYISRSNFSAKFPGIAGNIQTIVNQLIYEDNPDDPLIHNNPVLFSMRGSGEWKIAGDIDFQVLWAIVSDLAGQISAVDYWERARELPVYKQHGKPPRMPGTLALVTALAVNQFAGQLGLERGIEVLPREMRSRLVRALTSTELYDDGNLPKVDPDDPAPDARRYTKNELSMMISKLLGVETIPRKTKRLMQQMAGAVVSHTAGLRVR